MKNKKPFSDSRWRDWFPEGITTGGEPKPEVHKAIQKWLRENPSNEEKNKRTLVLLTFCLFLSFFKTRLLNRIN
jgi:hypothetical protein